MLYFDEVIWRLGPDLKSGREVVHIEKDVNYDESTLGDEDKIKMLVQSLIGQDAHCAYANKLTVLPFHVGSNNLWAVASDDVAEHDAYSILLTFL